MAPDFPQSITPAGIASIEGVRCGMTLRPAGENASRAELAERLGAAIGMPDARVVVGEQVHCAGLAVVLPAGSVVDADDPRFERISWEAPVEIVEAPAAGEVLEVPAVDALVSSEPGVLLGVFTADCVPLLFADVRTGRLAAAHAGREGTRRRIAAGVVACMRALGSRVADLGVWIGPSVCAAHYEVSEEMAAGLRKRFGDCDCCFTGPERRCVDLRALNRRELIAAGVREDRIEVDPRCTVEHPDLFFSYRRDGAEAGRMLAFVGRAV